MNHLYLLKIAFLFFIAFVIFTSCGKKGSTTDPTPITTVTDTAKFITWPSNADIYLVGTISNPFPQNAPAPTLWKNGVATTLNTGISYPMGIAVSSNDVYIVGADTFGSSQVAMLWKNGVVSKLPGAGPNSIANAIAVIGSDVYVAGTVSNKATLWKNGVIITTIVTPTTAITEATSIFVNGSDVYLAGNIYNQLTPNAYMNAALWKNGQPVNLDGIGGLNESHTHGVYAKGNDVYVVGSIPFKGAALWKNGALTILAQNVSAGTPDATSIAMNGNDIYVTGYVNGQATLWKNGSSQTLPYYTSQSVQPQILIGFNNADVYLAAGFDNKSPINNTLLWINGTGYKFSYKLAEINGMTIVTH